MVTVKFIFWIGGFVDNETHGGGMSKIVFFGGLNLANFPKMQFEKKILPYMLTTLVVVISY